jgi:hypothetical protein
MPISHFYGKIKTTKVSLPSFCPSFGGIGVGTQTLALAMSMPPALFGLGY